MIVFLAEELVVMGKHNTATKLVVLGKHNTATKLVIIIMIALTATPLVRMMTTNPVKLIATIMIKTATKRVRLTHRIAATLVMMVTQVLAKPLVRRIMRGLTAKELVIMGTHHPVK